MPDKNSSPPAEKCYYAQLPPGHPAKVPFVPIPSASLVSNSRNILAGAQLPQETFEMSNEAGARLIGKGIPLEAADSALRMSNWNAFQAPPHSDFVYSAYSISSSSKECTGFESAIIQYPKNTAQARETFPATDLRPSAALKLTTKTINVSSTEKANGAASVFSSKQPNLVGASNQLTCTTQVKSKISHRSSLFWHNEATRKYDSYQCEAYKNGSNNTFLPKVESVGAFYAEKFEVSDLKWLNYVIEKELDHIPCTERTKSTLKKIALDSFDNKVCRQSLDDRCVSGENCSFVHLNHILTTYEAKKKLLLDIKNLSKPTRSSEDISLTARVSQRSLLSRKTPDDIITDEVADYGSVSVNSESDDQASMLSDRATGLADFQNEGVVSSLYMTATEYTDLSNSSRSPSSVSQLVGSFINLARDQQGCRFLQRALDDSRTNDAINGQHDKAASLLSNLILAETLPVFSELMMDPFGNYLCQKVMEFSSEDQRLAIAARIQHEVGRIAINMHGTRSIQKLIQLCVSCPSLMSQMREMLCPIVVDLIKNVNGNHVIRKCLSSWQAADLNFIFSSLAVNCIEVASHRHGCCVIQRCLDRASTSQRHVLASKIALCALHLIPDPFGNYVIQYVLTLEDSRGFIVPTIISAIKGHVIALSSQKFSSNVIEKCIRVSEPIDRSQILEEIFRSKSVLSKLLRDSYANYVVQTSIDYVTVQQRNILIECLVPLLPFIQNTPYGRRIMAKLEISQKIS